MDAETKSNDIRRQNVPIADSRVAPFVSDRRWEFAVPPAQLWSILSDTSSFAGWWPWLRTFEPVPLEVGQTTRCAIGPPLPYLLRVRLAITEVDPGSALAVDVSGDVRGPARLEVTPSTTGSAARLAWQLDVSRPLLRRVAVFARPMLQWGHDWVVDRGVDQFRRAALDGRGGQL